MRTAALALALLALLPAAAAARTVSVSRGDVTAALRYTQDGFQTTVQRLTITRAGQVLFSGKPNPKACRPAVCEPVPRALKPLRIRDVQGDGEPEVIYSSFSGGAHCCTVAEVYSHGGGGYSAASFNFTDSGFVLRDFDSDGKLEWVSRDPQFDYAFTAYAFSGKPIQIFHFAGKRFREATSAFPRQVRRDARLWLHRYRQTSNRDDGVEYGPVAAWAADRYRLGKRDATLRFLRGEARRGLLKPRGKRFVTKLDRFLRRLGYA